MPGECGVGLDAPRVKENGAHCWFGVCHFFFFFFKFKFCIFYPKKKTKKKKKKKKSVIEF